MDSRRTSPQAHHPRKSHICADLDDILDQARCRIKQGRYDQALDITLFVLLTAVKLVGEVDSVSGRILKIFPNLVTQTVQQMEERLFILRVC